MTQAILHERQRASFDVPIVDLENALILGGTGWDQLSQQVAQGLSIPHASIKADQFPDQETLITVPPEVEGKEVVYIKSTPFPQNKNLMELFLTVDALRNHDAKKIHLVIPYYAHARQDKEFIAGQSKSAETVARIIQGLGVNSVFTIDAHFHRDIGPYNLFNTGIPAYNMTAMARLADFIQKKYKVSDPIVVIPDKGHRPTHNYIRHIFNSEPLFFSKFRHGPTSVSMTADGDLPSLSGRDVVVFDDMISSGTTLIEAVSKLQQLNPQRVFAAATHAMYPIDGQTSEPRDVDKALKDAGVTETVTAETTTLRKGVGTTISIGELLVNAISQRAFA